MKTCSPSSRTIDCRGQIISFGEGTVVMGILNATPDSFSDGGKFIETPSAVEHAQKMAADGAAIIDVGGQSTRPGFAEISAEVELLRVLPVVRALRRVLNIPLSIDTYKPAVAQAVLSEGVELLNDQQGLQGDPALAQLAAEFGCAVIAMHQESGFREDAADPLERLKRYFEKSVQAAKRAGISLERLIIDPGIGFHKTHSQNLEIIARLDELRVLGFPILIGVSRKSTIGQVLDLPSSQRLEGTLAVTAISSWLGVEMVRVHDVAANVRAARMATALRRAKLS